MLVGSPILSEKKINAKHKYSVIIFKNLPIIRLLVALEFIRGVLNFLLRVKKLAKKFVMIIIIKILANFLPIFVTRNRKTRALRNSRYKKSYNWQIFEDDNGIFVLGFNLFIFRQNWTSSKRVFEEFFYSIWKISMLLNQNRKILYLLSFWQRYGGLIVEDWVDFNAINVQNKRSSFMVEQFSITTIAKVSNQLAMN